MLSRILLVLSLLQVLLIYAPPLVWELWLAHFVALEGCLLATVLGLGALYLGHNQPIVQFLAVIGMMGGLAPALAVIPVYIREQQSFSIVSYLTGGSRPDIKVEKDIALTQELRADLYHAPGAGPHPFVMVVHGGSWRSGDKGDASAESMAFAAAGFSVVDVQYRLAPQFPFPAGIQDIKCLLGRVRERSTEFNLDPERVALLGRSAGGQLALLSAYSDIPPSCSVMDRPVQAVISIYGPTDLAWAHAHPFVPDVVSGTSALEQYLGGTPAQSPENYRLATPMTWAAQAIPTLLIHGTGEHCVRPVNAERLRDTLLSHGKAAKLVLIPMADHGFDIRTGGFGAQLARGVIVDFLRRSLNLP
jgi:acetyl esterase/lipase